MKKLISMLLIFVAVLTVTFASPMHILAAEEGKTVLVMKGRENTKSQEFEIDVTVEENSGVCGMLLTLVYDTSVFTLTDLEYGSAFSSLSPIHTNTETDEGYGIYPFKITYLGEKNDISIGKMMTLRFRVNDNAPDGEHTIILKHERDKDVTYLNGTEILTKNLLIDGARITLSSNKVSQIDTITNNDQKTFLDELNGLWLPVVIGGLVFVSGLSLLVSLIVKRNKTKKWKRI